MRADDYWARVERDEGKATGLINEKLRKGIAEGKRTLAHSYQDQIEMREEALNGEQSDRRAEERELELLQRTVAAEELERLQKQRAFKEHQKRVAVECTNAVRLRKEADAEAACAYEKFVTNDRAALDEARDTREVVAKRKREEKRRGTALLIDRAAKGLDKTRVNSEGTFDISDSEVRSRMERERQERDQERLRANQQRNRDYNAFVREKDQRATDRVDVADFEAAHADVEREAEARWRATNLRRLRSVQEQQAEEKRQQEWAEIQERRNEGHNGDTMYFLPDNER
jgi:hypothetical protein